MKKRLAIIHGTHPSHDARRLLRCLLRRLSIGREDLIGTTCYPGKSRELPTKKSERLAAMTPHRLAVVEFIQANGPCVVVGMGRLACEILTGASALSTRVCTCWPTEKYGKVWITYSPEAALYNPDLAVDIGAVLTVAAKVAGIPTEFNSKIPMFDWEPYEKFQYCEGTGVIRLRNSR